MLDNPYIRRCLSAARGQDSGQSGFIRTLSTVFDALAPCLAQEPQYAAAGLLEHLAQPERAAVFPVLWRDGRGQLRQNHGFFLRCSTALGPCRYDLVLRRDMDMGAAKAMALEATLRNALANLSFGGGLVGADIDPAALTDAESARFCAAFMEGLFPLLPRAFSPAAWAGQAHSRELGYLAGRHDRLAALIPGGEVSPTGEAGPMTRAQATGYGLVYFAQCALRRQPGVRLEGQSILIYGCNGAGPWAGEKAVRMGAQVTAIGDSGGFLYAAGGLPLDLLRAMAAQPGLPLLLWALRSPGVEFRPGPGLWDIPADVVFLCGGTVDGPAAARLAAHRPLGVLEGALQSVRSAAEAVFTAAGSVYAPAIAAGAGGAIMASRQTGNMTRWEADRLLRAAMEKLYQTVWAESMRPGGPEELAACARVAAVRPIADALLEKGCLL